MIRVAIVAATQALRAGLRALLASDDLQVIAEAAAADELLDLAEPADVLVAEASVYPEGSRFTAEEGAPPVLWLVADAEAGAGAGASTRREPGLAEWVGPGRGPWGWLTLDTSTEELQAAVRALHAGLQVSAPALIDHLLLRPGEVYTPAEQELAEALTPRETEVLQLLSQGLANKQIAAALQVSEHTVKFHISSIFAKLGATSRTEAVRLGLQHGLIVL